jgi:hypothetical protein
VLFGDEIILTREYFYVGFHDGEVEDCFYFDFQFGPQSNALGISTGSFRLVIS